MLSRIAKAVANHVRNNLNTYFFLLMAFIIGVSAGAFTVNGLSVSQREELTNYFQGFLQLLDNQKIESGELINIALAENAKVVAVLWILGATIIGIPFIYLLVGIRGFITGFSSGFIIETLGAKGLLFTLFGLLPKELIIVPCIIALGVCGINFSLNIIKNRSIKRFSKESLKSNFIGYCMTTLFFSCFIAVGILVEVYVTPVFIKMVAPLVIN